MKITKLLTISLTLFAFCVLAEPLYPSYSMLSVANAEAEGPALKLRKAAKLHVGPSGPSAVLEIVFKNQTCIWLDKKDVWVKVRMKKGGHIGWIHHDYLAPAVRPSRVVR